MNDFGGALAAIRDALANLTEGGAGSAILALAAVAAVAMAILQILKEITPARLWFQRRWIRRWLAAQVQAFDAQHAGDTKPRRANQTIAQQSLVELATGRLEVALYDLPAEDLVQQANAAGQIVLDEPTRYPDLLYLLSQGASAKDLDLVEAGPPLSGSTQDYFEARARLTRRMTRNLEGARLAMSNRWKLWMQITALTLTVLALEAVVWNASHPAAWLLAIPIGLVGGYIAPIARDLVAALQRLRGDAT